MKIGLVQTIVPLWRHGLYRALESRIRQSGSELHLFYDFHAIGMDHHKSAGPIEDLNCHHLELKHGFGAQIAYLRGLSNAIVAVRPNVVITDANPRFVSVWGLAGLKHSLGINLYGWSPGYFSKAGALVDLYRRGFFRLFDGMIAYHTRAYELFRYRYGLKRVLNAGNAVDDEEIRREIRTYSRDEILQLRRNLLDGADVLVLFVGRLTPGKRVELLLHSAALLGVHYRIVIIGSGPEETNLRRLAEQMSLKNVTFLGRIEKGVNRYFQAADVFVLPGLGGLALVQALHNGLPIVSTPADGIGYEAVEDGVNGFLREAFDPVVLANLIAKFRDQRIQEEFSKASQRIAKRFSIDTIAARIYEFITSPT